jgi:hypothetical protein
MPRVEIIGSAYSGKSIISSGQETVNLYGELSKIDPEAPATVTYYPTPGTLLYSQVIPPFVKKARAAYRSSIGTAYYVIGQNVYVLTVAQVLVFIGAIADLPSQVIFSDNGIVATMVDGQNGYVIDLQTNQIGIIIDPNFYPASWVALLDTFFIYNRFGTNQFFISGSNVDFGILTNSAVSTGTIVAGAAYTNGTYSNIPLTGGHGSGATAEITVAGGVVTVVQIDNGGKNYIAGDVLSATAASIGGTGAGFTYTVTGFATGFDPLDIAAKSGFSDPIVGIVAIHRELWLIGQLTTEIWIGTGAADFYFQEVQGAYINHGCAAQYSIATQDVLAFFLQQDLQGNCLVLMGQGYDISEISTPRLVSIFRTYTVINDAIGFCFQIEDHSYYALIFPTANKGWLYDLTTSKQLGTHFWSEWNFNDANGNFNRPRANCCMFFNGANLVGDWENGTLLKLDINTNTDYTDNKTVNPIIRVKTFPHMVATNNRIVYSSFDADIECGTAKEGAPTPQLSLSWSDDKGRTYGNPLMQSMGNIGEYLTVPSWNRLGEARDRVFKLSWSDDVVTALNGAFIETRQART